MRSSLSIALIVCLLGPALPAEAAPEHGSGAIDERVEPLSHEIEGAAPAVAQRLVRRDADPHGRVAPSEGVLLTSRTVTPPRLHPLVEAQPGTAAGNAKAKRSSDRIRAIIVASGVAATVVILAILARAEYCNEQVC